jgi:DNA-binding Lrp family transcriptional regulator
MRMETLYVAMPKQKILDLLYELMKNSKRSDRELAKVVGVSQPTITRMRNNLEKSGFIREYTVIPAFEKLGFEIIALSFLSTSAMQEHMKEIQVLISKNSKILFSSSGEGLNGNTLLVVSIHKDFTDFSMFTKEFRSSLGSKVSSVESFLVSLKTDVIKHFSFKNLERI